MSLASLASLEAQMHRQLRTVPLMTMPATYTARAGSPVQIRVLLDDGALLRVGVSQTAAAPQRVVRIARTEVTPVPRETLTIDGVVWRIVDLFASDEGQTSWVLERAR